MGFRPKAASTELEMHKAELDSLRDSLESGGNEQPELRALLQVQTEGVAMTEGMESLSAEHSVAAVVHRKRLPEEAVKTFLQGRETSPGQMVAAVPVLGGGPTPPDVGLMSQSRQSLPVAVWLKN